MRHWWYLPLALAAPLTGCGEIKPNDPVGERRSAAVRLAQARSLKRACGSQQTFERLKALAFEEAVRVRRADTPELRRLAGVSVARMEDPVATTRDEGLGLTVCSGRLVVELPPGAEDVFDGDRRIEARVEYAAQQAAHGEGVVYRMRGAEPIVYRLAAFDLPGRVAGEPGGEPVALASADLKPAAVPPKADMTPAAASEPVPSPVRPRAKPAASNAASPKSAPVATKRAKRPEPPARLAEVRRQPGKTKADARPGSPERTRQAAFTKKPVAKPVLKAQTRGERGRPATRLASSNTAPAAERSARSAARAKPPAKLAKADRDRPASTRGRSAAASPVRRAARLASSAKPPVRVAAMARKRPSPAVKVAKAIATAARRPAPRAPAARAARPSHGSAPSTRVAEVRRTQSRPAARPDDGCARIRDSVDRLVCSDSRLSRADRRMGATLHAALADADPETRAELRRSRARFQAYRDRCPSAGCVAQAYADRMEEIRDIASGNY